MKSKKISSNTQIMIIRITITSFIFLMFYGCSSGNKNDLQLMKAHGAVHKNAVASHDRIVFAHVIGYNNGKVVVRYNEMNTYTQISKPLPIGSKVQGYEDSLGNFLERKL